MEEKIRVQKYLSMSWICSRRKAEKFIIEWQIKINGKIAILWDKVFPWKDKVELLDNAIKEQKELVYYKINKPRWIITTCAEYWDKNIIDIVKIKERVFPIWRLDKESTWLIILTNDWRLTNYLIHPRYNHEKEYIVETFWPITDLALSDMSKWMIILWSMTKTAEINRISSWTFSMILTEWKNRQIRRMVEKVWCKVKKLKRVRIENINLWSLKEWEYEKINKEDLWKLFLKIGLK